MDVFKNLITTFLNTIPVTRNYYLIIAPLNSDLIVFIPAPALPFTSITTLNKTFNAFSKNCDKPALITMTSELFHDIQYRHLRIQSIQ